MKNTKQGAMFGLDARVALSIFGALSIITGTALYNAFQEAKIVAIIAEMDNIDKAVAQYYIDTGIYPDLADSMTNGRLKSEELLFSSIKEWKGPYVTLQDEGAVNDGLLEHPVYSQIRIYKDKDSDWESPAINSSKCLSTSNNCSVYVCYFGVSSDIQKGLELKIDGMTSANNSGIRYNSTHVCKRGMTYDKTLAPAS